MSAYVVVPPDGEPVLICGPGGAHREAVRRATPLKDVRHSRWGSSGEVIVDLIKEWGLADATVGISHVDPVYGHHLPVDEWERLRDGLPEATLERVGDFFHELVHVKSAEEIECVRKAGKLMDQAFHAMIAAARPESPNISWPPQPPTQSWMVAVRWISTSSGRRLWTVRRWCSAIRGRRVVRSKAGDIILNELACGYNGYSVQNRRPYLHRGTPSWIREFFDDVVLPGYDDGGAGHRGQQLGRRDESQPVLPGQRLRLTAPLPHCIDFVSHTPHVMWDHVVAEDNELDLRPGP